MDYVILLLVALVGFMIIQRLWIPRKKGDTKFLWFPKKVWDQKQKKSKVKWLSWVRKSI